MSEYLRANQKAWNAWVPHHVASKFYDVEGFKAGRESLDSVELDLVGEARGKRLLHLQCHFGLDTLSWARRGAVVTGVDFSSEGIRAARALAREMKLEATFVESDVRELPDHLDGEFDIVFSSHGVLPWLPDLKRWAEVIAHFLRPGGAFCLVEGHPFAYTLEDGRADQELRPVCPYFERTEPLRFEQTGSYAVPDAVVPTVTYEWPHSISEILGSLLRAGLRIESFQEYPYLAWDFFPWMVKREDGYWEMPGGKNDFPFMFSLRAVR